MDTPWLEQLQKNQKILIGELLKGKESATQLQTLLQKPSEDHGSVSAAQLTQKILGSFTETLSLLSFNGDNENCRILGTDGAARACPSRRSSKTLDGNRKRQAAARDRRGCYRRRNASESRIKFSSTTEDGYAWRKYGQKQILNSNFQRCYFRCTHKHDQGCKATKQVQRIKQDPPMHYQTTYFGHHTCKDPMRDPHIISGESDPMESCLLSFETKAPTPTKQYSHCSAVIPATKETVMEDMQSGVSDNKSGLDSTLWQDLMTSESSAPFAAEEVVSSFSSDYAYPSTTFHGPDMDDFSEFDELGNDLYLVDDSDYFHRQPLN